jgi:glycosyltransferase involved in cell wall biosynthesis
LRILFACIEDSNDQNVWSGLVYYIRKTLERHFEVVVYDKMPFECPLPLRVYHQLYKRFSKKIHHLQLEPAILKKAAKRIEKKFREQNCDAVFCPGTGTPVNTFIDTSIPVFIYMDASKLSWIETYFGLNKLSARSKKILMYINRHALINNRLTIFSSDWAMQSATKEMGDEVIRTAVVPFGANLSEEPTHDEVVNFIESRDWVKIKLLFLGKEWKRKGGNESLDLVKAVRALGMNAELHVVGCKPEIEEPLPEWVITHGFLDRSKKQDADKFHQILANSHLLLFFSKAEAYGLALCEANAFGVPCIATDVNGITTIIKNGKNGYLFQLPLKDEDVTSCIAGILQNINVYQQVAVNARKEYENRLNWNVAGSELEEIIKRNF